MVHAQPHTNIPEIRRKLRSKFWYLSRSAIRTKYRLLLRSSSISEPRHRSLPVIDCAGDGVGSKSSPRVSGPPTRQRVNVCFILQENLPKSHAQQSSDSTGGCCDEKCDKFLEKPLA